MGIDCKLLTEKGDYYLDRWYPFNYSIEENKIYKKDEFIKKLKDAIDSHIEDYRFEIEDGKFPDKDYFKRCLWGCYDAIFHCGEINTIMTDTGNDLYFEHNILDEKLINILKREKHEE